jgi:lipopolysaccharide export system protein LptA
MRRAALLIALCAAAGAASAAQAPAGAPPPAAGQSTGPKPDTSKPINVNSDNLFADIKANIGIYTGHVVITQDTLKMRADEVKVIAANGKPTRLEARGNIVFVSPNGSAIGDFGVYDVNAHLITLTGRDVVLTRDQNVMHGTKLEVHTDTDVAQLYSQGENNGRVQGLFTPKSQPATGAKQSPPGPAKP